MWVFLFWYLGLGGGNIYRIAAMERSYTVGGGEEEQGLREVGQDARGGLYDLVMSCSCSSCDVLAAVGCGRQCSELGCGLSKLPKLL